jgi:Ca2+-binding EF-hand superfamily protein
MDRGRSSSDQSNSTYASRTIEVEPLVPGFGVDMELTPPSVFGAEADLFTVEITDQDRREAERAFGYYDRNRDRKIDAEEMKRSRYGSDLPLFDRNRDGLITLNEMEYRYAQRRVNNEGGSSTASKGSDSRKSSDKDEPEARWREKRDDDRKSYRAQAPIEGTQEGLPDWFARDDADADGQVAMAEFSVTWSDSMMSDFNQFDLNQDGMITPQECLKAGENGAVRGGSVGATSTDSSSAKSDASSGDSDSSSSDASSGASTADARPSPTPATPLKISPQYLKYYQSLVAKYDKNNDKVLVKDEWVSMSKDPAAADVDGNGRITVEEYARWSMKKL